MVGSRHSSLRPPSTTVTATVGAAVVVRGRDQPRRPAEQPGLDLRRSPAAAPTRPGCRGDGRSRSGGRGCGQPGRVPVGYPPKGPMRRGGCSWARARRRGGSVPPGGRVRPVAADSTRSASDHGGAAGRPRVSRGAHADVLSVDARRSGPRQRGRRAGRRARGPARAGGSPQRVGGAGRRARGHAQDPFSLGVRRGSRPRVAFRCGMAMREGAVTGAVCQDQGRPNRPPLSDRNHPVPLRLPDQPG